MGMPFRVPNFALERTDLQQLLVVINLVLRVNPALADNPLYASKV